MGLWQDSRIFCVMLALLFLGITMPPVAAQVSSVENCIIDQDVVIVIDDSDSTKRVINDSIVYSPSVVAFVVDLIERQQLNPSRAALIRVSNTAEVLQDFTTDSTALVNALFSFTPEFAEQNTQMGINAARNLFTTSGRAGVNKYAIFVTDGLASSREMLETQADLSRDEGITSISISFAGEQPCDEGLAIAGNEGRIFVANNDTQLVGVTTMVVNQTLSVICDECKNFGDIVVLADDSDSTRRLNEDQTAIVYSPSIKTLLDDLLNVLNLGNTRVGITLFSTTSRIIANITDDPAVLQDAINNIAPEWRGTRPDLAFESARAQLAASEREGATKIIVYLVDGRVDDFAAFQTQANLAAAEGITVVSIGFSNAAPPNEVGMATSNPDTVLLVDSDTDLPGLLGNITAITCQSPE